MTAMSAYLDTARRVIRIEIDGLQALAAGLDDSFDRAIEIILAARGRVVVSGMGNTRVELRVPRENVAAVLGSVGNGARISIVPIYASAV